MLCRVVLVVSLLTQCCNFSVAVAVGSLRISHAQPVVVPVASIDLARVHKSSNVRGNSTTSVNGTTTDVFHDTCCDACYSCSSPPCCATLYDPGGWSASPGNCPAFDTSHRECSANNFQGCPEDQ